MRAQRLPLATRRKLDSDEARERRIVEHMRRVEKAEVTPEQRQGVAVAGEQRLLFVDE